MLKYLVVLMVANAARAEIDLSMYQDPRFQGDYLRFTMYDECQDLIPEFNDRASSLKVNTYGGCVKVCEDYGCVGNCIKIGTEGSEDLTNLGFNNKISSVQDCNPKPEVLVTGVRIPGTNLITDTWYRVNLKNTGLLTWSYAKTDVGYHIQIVYGKAAQEYNKGERYWDDAFWMIKESEIPGQYVLVNRKLMDAAITWCCKSSSGKWVVAASGLATSPDYSPGGQYRADNLWRFESDSGDDNSRYYSIYNARFPANGILTWSNDDVGEGRKYVQIYDGTSKDAGPDKWKHDKDYLWEFTAVEP